MRLIDADLIEPELRAYADQRSDIGEIELANGILNALYKIREIPTIDPKDLIPHGKWEWLAGIACCSGCGKPANGDPYDGVLYITDYCPNCGAKMDKE